MDQKPPYSLMNSEATSENDVYALKSQPCDMDAQAAMLERNNVKVSRASNSLIFRVKDEYVKALRLIWLNRTPGWQDHGRDYTTEGICTADVFDAALGMPSS